MKISVFDYALPDELIAQEPRAERENSRMLVVERAKGTFYDSHFFDLPKHLQPGDVLVLNNTKVFPARLFGVTESGANVEVFLIRETAKLIWEALVRPARRLKPGRRVFFGDRLIGVVVEKFEDGRVTVRFDPRNASFNVGDNAAEGGGDPFDFDEIIDAVGRTPLPPYIKRDKEPRHSDRERYQTVFAKNRGAIAAPTAGLHFTAEVLDRVADLGVEIVEITLHVGYGTFEPVRADDLSHHTVMPERYVIDEKTANALNTAKDENRRIIAVGTTTSRTLENAFTKHGRFAAEDDFADLTIRPGYKFRAIDGLLTNFHLPQSSLLVLVSTFGGHQLIMNAYKHTVKSKYRFYSYGDCMLIV